ncbi:MAG: DUF4157 domain-containing protein [Leptolyngbya sp. SIO1D8]|nr:DUF4157 domain-containing protein [Leptolyngbya sp. SIO1D8]
MTQETKPQTQQQTPTTHPLTSGGILQRQCQSCGQHAIAEETCGTCEPPQPSSLVRRHLRGSPAEIDPPAEPLPSSHFSHNFSHVQVKTQSPKAIQPKLTVSQPHDPYEQEADRVAQQIVNLPDAPLSQTVGALRATPNPHIQRRCQDCEEEQLQLKPIANHPATIPVDLASQLRTRFGTGQSLPESARAFFEPRFRRPFNHVRIHTDNWAAKAAHTLGAQAFTIGQNIVFGAGQYAPNTLTGKQLLAHELTHVVQQTAHAAPVSGQVQRQVSSVAAASASDTTPASEFTSAAIRPLIVEDTEADLQSGQMRKADFLRELRTVVCSTAEAELANTPHTTAGCPYLAYWFTYYETQDSQHVERVVHRYAPETARAETARDYISIISDRVRQAVYLWLTTQQVPELPEEISPEALNLPTSGNPQESGASTTDTVLFKARTGGAHSIESPQAIRDRLDAGHPLANRVKSRMETAFATRFPTVRVHTGAQAANLSADLNARAFTVGQDIAFAAGEYQPGTLLGDALIAHELAHVLQQRGSSPALAPLQTGTGHTNTLEWDADRSAIRAVVSLWGGLRNGLADIAENALPRLRSGLRLQRCPDGCGSSGCDPSSAPAPAPAPPAPAPPSPPAAPAPPSPTASDLQITGVNQSRNPNAIFFDRNSAAINATQAQKIPPLKSPAARALDLYGFISEDENVPPAAGTTLATDRITAVSTALSSSPNPHTGSKNPIPNTTAGQGQIDYRNMRKVVVRPAGQSSGVPNCAGGGIIPCSPATHFTTAQTQAENLLDPVITALAASPLAATTENLLDERFGTTAANRANVASLVRTNLVNLKDHILNQMTPIGAVDANGRTTSPGHLCANSCDSICDSATAYNQGRDANALMVLCDAPAGFMQEPDGDERAATLIHEGLHGITLNLTLPPAPAPAPRGAGDFAYGGQRLIRFLDTATAIKNNDSYVLFVRQLNGHSVTVGRATPDPATGVAMSATEREDVDRALAWLEGWLIISRQDVASLYTTVNAVIASGAWTPSYDRATMQFMAPLFGLSVPPAVPNQDDKFAIAAIHERLARMRGVLYRNSPVRINRVSAGTTHWSAGPGDAVTIGPDFFAIPPGPTRHRAQLDLLLAKMIEATSGISAGIRPQYATLVDRARTQRGLGSP